MHIHTHTLLTSPKCDKMSHAGFSGGTLYLLWAMWKQNLAQENLQRPMYLSCVFRLNYSMPNKSQKPNTSKVKCLGKDCSNHSVRETKKL